MQRFSNLFVLAVMFSQQRENFELLVNVPPGSSLFSFVGMGKKLSEKLQSVRKCEVPSEG